MPNQQMKALFPAHSSQSLSLVRYAELIILLLLLFQLLSQYELLVEAFNLSSICITTLPQWVKSHKNNSSLSPITFLVSKPTVFSIFSLNWPANSMRVLLFEIGLNQFWVLKRNGIFPVATWNLCI
jgi:hypothetical protein